MIRALFKFTRIQPNQVAIDTTSSNGDFRELSPFILSVIDSMTSRIVLFENLWQFSKVYDCHTDKNGEPSESWYYWRKGGINDNIAHRYPMGKGAIPQYSYLYGEKLSYIEARKKIYAPEYAKNVIKTDSFKRLEHLYNQYLHLENSEIVLLDYDAYDHQSLNMNLVDVINNPKRKMGHAFVLLMILTGELEKCIKS